jgi:hypothetical protein
MIGVGQERKVELERAGELLARLIETADAEYRGLGLLNFGRLSRKSQASFAQPGVSSFG